MKAVKYFLVSLLVISIVKKVRTNVNPNPLNQTEYHHAIPAKKLQVIKGSTLIGYFVPDKKIVQSKSGQTLFVDVVEKKHGNYAEIETMPSGIEALEEIGISQHYRLQPERPRTVTLYGARLIKPRIFKT